MTVYLTENRTDGVRSIRDDFFRWEAHFIASATGCQKPQLRHCLQVASRLRGARLTCRAAESTSTATSSTVKSGPMGTANRISRRPSASVTIGTMPGPGAGRRCGGRWNGSSMTSRDEPPPSSLPLESLLLQPAAGSMAGSAASGSVAAVGGGPSRQCIQRVSTKSGRSMRRSIVCQPRACPTHFIPTLSSAPPRGPAPR